MDAKTTFSGNVLTAIFSIIYIFIEVNEQIKRFSLVITSFQVLL